MSHILGGVCYAIPKLIVQGKIEGQRIPSRKQHLWLHNIGVEYQILHIRLEEEGGLYVFIVQ